MTSSAFTGKNTAKSDRPLTALKPPIEFLKNIKTGFPGGAAWLERLPALLAQTARRWQLVPGDPFLLSYNYVCTATQRDGSAAVLKIGVPHRELSNYPQFFAN
jgi:streptomycin 6-kinase